MKRIPNILSFARIPLALLLLPAARYFHPAVFVALYAVTGLTDALDGYLARRYHWESRLGSKVDGFADMVFLLSMLTVVFLIVRIRFNLWVVAFVAAIAMVRLTNLIFTRVKFKQWGTMHSAFIRYATIPIYFVAPICVWTGESSGWLNWLVAALLFAVLLSVMEETWILSVLPEYDMNIKSIYHARRRRRAAAEEKLAG